MFPGRTRRAEKMTLKQSKEKVRKLARFLSKILYQKFCIQRKDGRYSNEDGAIITKTKNISVVT